MTDQPADLPNQMPVSTCPRTDRHGYHMWPERPDADALCPGHPAPASAADHAYRDAVTAPLGDRDVRAINADVRAINARLALGIPTRTMKAPAWTTPDNPPASSVPCSAHVLRRPHLAHGWEPQPGMTPAHCPGVQAASDAARFPGRATVTIAIHAPNQDNADRWANTIRDLVTAEHGHHMRLDITIQAGGNDGLREQYAAAIRAKVDGTEGCANGHRLADAVLAVRDAELARLRELVTIEEERAECHKRVAANWGQQLDTVTATLAAIRRYAQAFGPTGVLDILDGKAGQ